MWGILELSAAVPAPSRPGPPPPSQINTAAADRGPKRPLAAQQIDAFWDWNSSSTQRTLKLVVVVELKCYAM